MITSQTTVYAFGILLWCALMFLAFWIGHKSDPRADSGCAIMLLFAFVFSILTLVVTAGFARLVIAQ
jgi:hypothetical protein